MSLRINIEHLVAHIHTQNSLAESLIKCLQLIARPLLIKTKLPISAWGHTVLHAATLIRIRPTTYHKFFQLQLVFGHEPNIFYLRIFGCAVYVLIYPPQHTKMSPQSRLRIYIGFESPSIIKYLEPLTGTSFTTRFVDCHFDETMFPALGGEIKQLDKDITWNALSLLNFYPRTKQCEQEVQKILCLQDIVHQLPNAFTDSKRVTKSYIPTAYSPTQIEVPAGQSTKIIANESMTCHKCDRPIGLKDKNF